MNVLLMFVFSGSLLFETGLFSQQIVPSQECVPLPVGNELNHVEVRERCVIELALYSAYYLADEKLVNRIAALRALQFKRDF